ncbi:MAG: hypothetical protein DIZ80_06365 [endosymbiont of Galathealinum brachiosum]|uniref:Chain length-determining protein n=1 Tax=endosymbiont of Galathealinum brachiosum TaxID=2200906 RepID=A0A370DHF4_9GAMM|nr:MAG: hypothetical protein DIZ80_06365 [endosymbiont of Galathealinum brachiosum]
MNLPIEDVIKLVIAEAFARRYIFFVLFLIISLTLLSVGSVWPKRYSTFSIIQANDSNILQPLMKGTAVATTSTAYVKNAEEIIYGEEFLNKILPQTDWLVTKRSDIELAEIKKDLRHRLSVRGIGNNTIKIEYHDTDPMQAFVITKGVSELFVKMGEESKITESQSAYDFIEKQVNEYLEKLTTVEETLREFRSNNPGARPGLETEVSGRISRITSDIERTRLEIRETEIRRDSLQKQLSGEAAITISQSREGQYRAKIADLQTRLENLRLDYKDTYPDIVRIKHQIEDLKQSMKNEMLVREEAKKLAGSTNSQYVDEAILLNPLYQKLRSDASTTQTKIATLQARITELSKMLNNEYKRAKEIHGGEATLSKLTRDYQVNQEIYQDLLRRMEKARVSRNLDKENQGLTFKIQEPAKIPLIPTGIRFLHFMVAGLALGITAPFALIFIMLQVDPRLRFSRVIQAEMEIPVLAEIPMITTKKEDRSLKVSLVILLFGFCIILFIYGYVGWIKYTGQM